MGIEICDRVKTTFNIGDGLWGFSVMLFGLCNPPATFKRLMEHVLRGLHWKTCLIYLDDIISMGEYFSDHLKNLGEVFQRIASAGLRLNPKNCDLFKTEDTYLVHKVSTEDVQTDEEQIKADSQCFTKKNRAFVWHKEQGEAFQQLKQLLCTVSMLEYPVTGEKFVVNTDASAYRIEEYCHISTMYKVIAYYNRDIGKQEMNNRETRRELLAVVERVKHFQKDLYNDSS